MPAAIRASSRIAARSRRSVGPAVSLGSRASARVEHRAARPLLKGAAEIGRDMLLNIGSGSPLDGLDSQRTLLTVHLPARWSDVRPIGEFVGFVVGMRTDGAIADRAALVAH